MRHRQAVGNQQHCDYLVRETVFQVGNLLWTITHLGWRQLSLLPMSSYMAPNMSFKTGGNTTNC